MDQNTNVTLKQVIVKDPSLFAPIATLSSPTVDKINENTRQARFSVKRNSEPMEARLLQVESYYSKGQSVPMKTLRETRSTQASPGTSTRPRNHEAYTQVTTTESLSYLEDQARRNQRVLRAKGLAVSAARAKVQSPSPKLLFT